jgi:hypothetical protein
VPINPACVSACCRPWRGGGHGGRLQWHAERVAAATSGQPDYDLARRSFNPLFDNRRPAAIAQCQRIEDVQARVSAAAAEGMPIAARSGGHSYAGYSASDSALIVDTTSMTACPTGCGPTTATTCPGCARSRNTMTPIGCHLPQAITNS